MARDPLSEACYAIKILRQEERETDAALQRELRGLRAYTKICLESDLLLKILHSDKLENGVGFYYVMELADEMSGLPLGVAEPYVPRTLANELARRKRLPVEEVIQIGISICESLSALHTRGLAHRDVKPSNVLYVRGRLKLADIGLVNEGREAGSVLGSDGFVPPDNPGSMQADLYALGKLLYILATGLDRLKFPRLPLDWDSFPDKQALVSLNPVILKACGNSQSSRYQTAEEFKEDLCLISRGMSLWRKRSERRLRSLKIVIAGVVSCVAILLVRNSFLEVQNRTERRRAVALEIANGMRYAEDGDTIRAMGHFVEAMQRDTHGTITKRIHQLRVGFACEESPSLTEVWFGRGGVDSLHWNSTKTVCAFSSNKGDVQLIDLRNPHIEGSRLLSTNCSTRVALSPDSDFIATAFGETGMPGEVRVYDVRNRSPLDWEMKLDSHVRGMTFDTTGTHLAVSCDDGTVRVCSMQTGEPVSPILTHGQPVRIVQFNPVEDQLLTAGWDGTARLWNYRVGRETGARMRHEGYIRSAAYSPNGRLIATTGDDGYVKVWSARDGQELFEPVRLSSRGLFLVFRADSLAVLCTTADGIASVLSTKDGRLIGNPVRHRNAIRYGAFSADGTLIATTSSDQTARVWEVSSGTPLTPPLYHSDEVNAAQFLQSDSSLMTASTDGTVKLWKLPSPSWGALHPVHLDDDQRFAAVSIPRKLVVAASPSHDITVHAFESTNIFAGPFRNPAGVVSVKFSPDTNVLLSTTVEGQALLWNLQRPGIPPVVLQHSELRADRLIACFSPNGKLCATGGRDRAALVWNVEQAKQVSPPLLHSWSVGYVEFSRSGRFLCTSTWDAHTHQPSGLSEAIMWTVGNYKRFRTFNHADAVMQLRLSPDENYAITVSEDKTAQLWSVDTGLRIHPPFRHDNGVSMAEFSPDGAIVVTASHDHSARIWEVATGRQIGSRLHHEGAIQCLAFSKDGQILVTGAQDKTMRLWSTRTGEPISQPLRHKGRLTLAAFADDESTLYSCSRTELLRTWPLSRMFEDQADLTRKVELLNGQTLDATGNRTPIDGATFWEMWNRRHPKPGPGSE